MKRTFIKIVSVVGIIISLLTTAVSAVTMYAPDGRTAKVMDSDVSAWKKVGWYTFPVAKVYAKDGRTAIIAKSDVQAWLKVGWYDKQTVKMYAPGGKIANVYIWDVNNWKKVGWYDNLLTCIANSSNTAFYNYFSKNPISYAYDNDYRWSYTYTTYGMLEIKSTYISAWEDEILWAYDRLIEYDTAYKWNKNNWLQNKDSLLQQEFDKYEPCGGTMDSLHYSSIEYDFYEQNAKNVYKLLYFYNPNYTYKWDN